MLALSDELIFASFTRGDTALPYIAASTPTTFPQPYDSETLVGLRLFTSGHYVNLWSMCAPLRATVMYASAVWPSAGLLTSRCEI